MKDQENKYLDDLAKKVMGESIESPSHKFIDNVMTQINNLSEATVYKPLISKSAWVFILLGFGALFIYLIFFDNQMETSNWLSSIDLSLFSKSSFAESLLGFKMTKTFMYAIILLALMSLIQVSLLKNYFNKRLNL